MGAPVDEQENYPTAIIPTRPEGIARRYDALARQFRDPLVTLFTLQDEEDPELRFKAAAELLPYRYPKLRAQEVTHKGDAGGAGGVNIQINFQTPGASPTSAAAPGPTVEVKAVHPDKSVEDLLA